MHQTVYYKYTSKGKTPMPKPIELVSLPLNEAKKIWTVKIDAKKTKVTLSNYCGRDRQVTVPAYVEGIPVAAIKDFAKKPPFIEEVIIPETVRTLSKKTCYRYENLSSVIMSDNTVPPSGAFAKCKLLLDKNGCIVVGGVLHQCKQKGDIVISSGITEIPEKICYGKFPSFQTYKITSVKISEGVGKIGAFAFGGQNSLTEVFLPSSIKEIGDFAFSECVKLTSINIPQGVKRIGRSAFNLCKRLSLAPPNHVAEIGDDAFMYCWNMADKDGFIIVKDTLYSYSGQRESIKIPDGVAVISDEAFCSHKEIKEIHFPASLKKIGSKSDICLSSTFSGCVGLADQDGFVIVDHCLFGYYGSDTTIQIPDGVTSIHSGCFIYSEPPAEKTTIIVPKSVLKIGAYAFSNVYVEFIGDVPKLLTDGYSWSLFDKIPDDAYTDNVIIQNNVLVACNYSGDSFSIPSGVKRIISGAILGNVNHIHVPDGVEIIEMNIFHSLSSNIEISLPVSVNEIQGPLSQGDDIIKITGAKGCLAEKYAKSQKYIFVPENKNPGKDIWTYKIYKDKTVALTSYSGKGAAVEVPSEIDGYTVTELGSNLFKGHSEIQTVTLPETLLKIGSKAFKSCSLDEIKLPQKLQEIGMWAFSLCGPGKEIVIPESVTRLGIASLDHFDKVIILGNPSIPMNGPVFNVNAEVYGHKGSTVEQYSRSSRSNTIRFVALDDGEAS